MKLTLRVWQSTEKPCRELIYNCSEYTRQNDEWVPFTIGIGWSFINVYKGNMQQFQVGPHGSLVFCAINTDTDNRRRPHGKNRRTILQTIEHNGIKNNGYFSSHEYFGMLSQYKFVISPEGNGIDCHRHYEALMAGCIPVIEDHPGIREKYAGCPVLYTNDYSEITPAYLEEKWAEMLDKEWDFSKLLLNSYDASTQEQIKKNGDFWGRKLANESWYAC
jgi:hypothetical protein